MRIDSKLTVFTLHDGTELTVRSALEARWVIFFTELRVKWSYEPKIVPFYVPDFFVEGLGYVEIKPTVELLISESSHKMAAAARQSPVDKFFAFVGNKVGFETVALYFEGKIFAPTWQQMVETFNRITNSTIQDSIGIAITRANGAKLDHFVRVGKIIELA